LGGSFHTLTHLISLGIPVIVERGVDGPDGWDGQYATVIGYDQSGGKMDVTLVPSLGSGTPVTISDEELDKGWRAFNYAYLIIYPKELKAELENLLGSDADPEQNLRNAVNQATREIGTTTGRDRFFAYFNLGALQTQQKNYAGAAGAFDTAYEFYWGLPYEQRPWRILWYQDSPYEAFFYTGRYMDVIALSERMQASAAPQSVLEESLYWHAVAKNAMGDRSGAIADLRELHSLNPNFAPGETLLQNLQKGGFAPGETDLTSLIPGHRSLVTNHF
jgi:tetratricopeptide (TPR) repeat protein